jgi:hypothetical protein
VRRPLCFLLVLAACGKESGPVLQEINPITGQIRPSDLDCNRDFVDRPDETEPFSLRLRLYDPHTRMPIAGARIEVFASASDLSDDRPYASGDSDEAGFVDLMHPPGSYRALYRHRAPGYVDSYLWNWPASPGVPPYWDHPIFPESGRAQWAQAAGGGLSGEGTLLAGVVCDCVSWPIANATVFGTIVETAIADPQILYTRWPNHLAVPRTTLSRTEASGEFAIIDAAPGVMRMEASGTRTEGGDPEVVGRYEVEPIADAFNFVFLLPLPKTN